MSLTKSRIPGNNWATQVPSVTIVCLNKHYDSCSNVRRCNKTLGLRFIKAHSIFENSRQEVRDGIRVGCGAHIQRRECPDFAVESIAEVGSESEGFQFNVVTVVLNSRNDIISLFLGQEVP